MTSRPKNDLFAAFKWIGRGRAGSAPSKNEQFSSSLLPGFKASNGSRDAPNLACKFV